MKKLWKCGGCGFVYDGEAAPEKCPKCGSEEFERVLSATNHAIAGGSGAGEARASTQFPWRMSCSASNKRRSNCRR